MAQEIERKFLVCGEYKTKAYKSVRITQGYILSDKRKSVRIRITNEKAFITIKGESSVDGLSRFEWEKEINVNEAKELLKLCSDNFIDKTRYLIKHGNHIIEVDEFHGDNEGLVIAEVELKSETDTFLKPDYLGEEVTGISKYYNSQLTKNPYTLW